MRRCRDRAVCLVTLIGALRVCSAVAADDSQQARTAEELVHSLTACVAQDDDARRLECYDKALQRPRAAHAAPEQRFGLSAAQVVQKQHLAETPKDVTSKVVAVGREPRGTLTVTLENGQLWAQQNADGQDLSISVGDSVTVSHEAMGGYLMSSSASGHRSMRVHRVK